MKSYIEQNLMIHKSQKLIFYSEQKKEKFLGSNEVILKLMEEK